MKNMVLAASPRAYRPGYMGGRRDLIIPGVWIKQDVPSACCLYGRSVVTGLGVRRAERRIAGSRMSLRLVGCLACGRRASRCLVGHAPRERGAKYAANHRYLRLRAKIARLWQMKHGASTPLSIGLVGFLVSSASDLPMSPQTDQNPSKIKADLRESLLATFADVRVQRMTR